MSGKNRLFKSGKIIRLWWDFCRIWKKCQILAGAEIRYSPNIDVFGCECLCRKVKI